MASTSPKSNQSLTLPVQGMSCASCVLRVEKALKKVDGVSDAAVNLATESARVVFDPSRVGIEQLQKAVADAGYTLAVPDHTRTTPPEIGGEQPAKPDVPKQLKNELILSVALTIPIIVLSMMSMTEWYMRESLLSIEATNRVLFLFTSPVIFICGRRFFNGFF